MFKPTRVASTIAPMMTAETSSFGSFEARSKLFSTHFDSFVSLRWPSTPYRPHPSHTIKPEKEREIKKREKKKLRECLLTTRYKSTRRYGKKIRKLEAIVELELYKTQGVWVGVCVCRGEGGWRGGEGGGGGRLSLVSYQDTNRSQRWLFSSSLGQRPNVEM